MQHDADSAAALSGYGPTLTAAIGVVLRAGEGGRGGGGRKQPPGQLALRRRVPLDLLEKVCVSAMLLTRECFRTLVHSKS